MLGIRKRTLSRSFTLLEIMIVLVVIMVITAIALPSYNKIKKRSLDKEAKANLKLIAAAEKVYRMEYGTYFGGSEYSVSDINDRLKLFLDTTTPNWDYKIPNASEANFTVNANSLKDDTTWTIDQATDEPY